MKKFKKGDKALINFNTRVKFYNNDKEYESYITKNLKRNTEVEIIKVEKAHPSVGGCSYYIKVNLDGKELISADSIPNNKFLPEECRKMLKDTRKELKEIKKFEL